MLLENSGKAFLAFSLLFIVIHSSHHYKSEEQCTLEIKIKNKLLVRIELTSSFALGKLDSLCQMLYLLIYKNIDGITQVQITATTTKHSIILSEIV